MFFTNWPKPYAKSFYSSRHSRSIFAANRVLSILKAHYSNYSFSSVLDVGCGTGTWLHASKEIFSSFELFGIEGDWLPESHFCKDGTLIRKNLDRPFDLSRKFDLTISLEVAEHISPNSASSFVSSLASTSDLILFSAAPPGQGGKHHVNEQPIGYWVELFASHGFQASDFIREEIWNDPNIDFWYKQNIITFEKTNSSSTTEIPLNIIHPDLFKIYSRPNSYLALKLFLRSIFPTLIKLVRKFTNE